MPPRKATAAQKGKSIAAGETSRAQVTTRARTQIEPDVVPSTASSATPPVPEGSGAATAAVPGAAPPPAPAAPVPVPPAPQPRADDGTLREAVQLLTQLVAGQVHRQGAGDDRADRRDSHRARDFLLCRPPEFSGLKPAEDPQEFVRQMQRSLRLISASETESVELASYRLHDVAANWYESWMLSRGEDAPPAVWGEFTEAFLAHFLPPEMRRARVDRFLLLRQRGRSVREYSLEFDSLARYASTYVADMTDRMHRYVIGLDDYLVDSCTVMAAQTGMDIARIQAHAQSMEDRRRGRQPDRDYDRGPPKRSRSARYSGESRGRQPQQQQSRYPPQPAQSTPPQFPGWEPDGAEYSRAGQSSRASDFQGDRGSSQWRPPLPRCSLCRRHHREGECRRATGACFTCGQQGHYMRDCPLGDRAGGAAQPTGSVAGSSSPSVAMRPMGRGTPAPAGRGRGRGGASSSGGPSNRLYALTSRQDPEMAPGADPGILLIFS